MKHVDLKLIDFFQESQNFLCNRLKSLEFNISKDEVFSSLGAARDLIYQRKLRPMLMLEPEALEVANPNIMQDFLLGNAIT